MSSLIKSSQALDIRGFGNLRAAAAPGGPPPPRAREEELAEELARARTALSEIEASLPDRLAAARAKGREEGMAQHQRDEKAQLELLRAAAAGAAENWRARLSAIEGLAVALARDILERVFGDEGLEPAAVAAAIRTRIAVLDERAVVRLRVASADVEQELIAQGLGEPGQWDIVLDPGLDEGEANIDLDLGAIEAGPAQQWPRIMRWLDELEAGKR